MRCRALELFTRKKTSSEPIKQRASHNQKMRSIRLFFWIRAATIISHRGIRFRVRLGPRSQTVPRMGLGSFNKILCHRTTCQIRPPPGACAALGFSLTSTTKKANEGTLKSRCLLGCFAPWGRSASSGVGWLLVHPLPLGHPRGRRRRYGAQRLPPSHLSQIQTTVPCI
jgi:hypothetical protein